MSTATDVPYSAPSGPSGGAESYIYYLNVCGEVATEECGKGDFISSCQVKATGGLSKVAGRYRNQTLRYYFITVGEEGQRSFLMNSSFI